MNYGDICQFIRDTCLFTSRDMGYLVPPIQASLISRKRNSAFHSPISTQGWQDINKSPSHKHLGLAFSKICSWDDQNMKKGNDASSSSIYGNL